jgi:hypothetical protein
MGTLVMGLPQKRHKNEDDRDVKDDTRSGERRERLSRMGILTAKNGENPKSQSGGKSGILKRTAGKFLRVAGGVFNPVLTANLRCKR